MYITPRYVIKKWACLKISFFHHWLCMVSIGTYTSFQHSQPQLRVKTASCRMGTTSQQRYRILVIRNWVLAHRAYTFGTINTCSLPLYETYETDENTEIMVKISTQFGKTFSPMYMINNSRCMHWFLKNPCSCVKHNTSFKWSNIKRYYVAVFPYRFIKTRLNITKIDKNAYTLHVFSIYKIVLSNMFLVDTLWYIHTPIQ